jgi:hypothetical protein
VTEHFPTGWTATTRLVRPGWFVGQIVRRPDEHRYERIDCPHRHKRDELARACATRLRIATIRGDH